jgi:4-amino-4-deoxy-L-arabinose transferase-like glycosyltransferase
MTHASEARDQTEAREPGFRGWFQPVSRPPAADAGGSRDNADGARADVSRWQAEAAARPASHGSTHTETSGADAHAPTDPAPADPAPAATQAPLAATIATPAEPNALPVGGDDPEDTGRAPQAQVSDPPARASEAQDTAVYPRPQASATHPDTGEPPTVIQALAARPGAPKFPPPDRPADITRPQLILDDTLVDIGGLRGGRNPRPAGTASSAPGSAARVDGDNNPEDAGGTSRLRASATRPDTSEPPTAIQAPAARPGAPKFPPPDRPADITRPQLILDDTLVDIGGLRGGRNPRPAGTASSASGSATASAAPPPGATSSARGAAATDAPPANGSGAPADPSGPPADKAPGKKSRSVFGPEPASRPDMLTNAETVIMPSLKDPKGKDAGQPAKAGDNTVASARNAAAARQQAITTMVPVVTNAAFAEAVTQVMPTMERSASPAPTAAAPAREAPVKRDRQPDPPSARYTPRRRTTMISRLALLAILCLQAVLSLRMHNTAFEDESLYLYSGHMELEHLLHGSALYGGFASYFSGSPILYPVAAAALDQVGGLTAARALSLFELLATTALLYSLTRRLFNERIGLCAAAFFSVSEAVIFLGNFATFDATCLALLASASWVVVRTAAFRWPVFLLAAPLAALAVAVKYAGLLFVPTIALLPALAGWPERGRRVLLYPLGFGVAVAGILYAALRLGGPAYMAAINSTTTNRAHGATTAVTILREAGEWGGVLFAAAVIGTIAYVWRIRTEADEKIAPSGGRVRRAALGVVLTGTALLAPAYQAHLHTDISFLKHIGFGLFFAAPMAGFGLARIMGDYFRRPQFGIGLWSLALVLGMVQSNYLYHVWPSSGSFVSAFSKYLKPNALYLVEVPEVPMYYLEGRPDAQPKQFTSTYSVPPLTTAADFRAVVKNGEFRVIAYTGVVTAANDQALAKALAASRSYHLASKISSSDSSGPVTYYIWVKGHKPTSGAKAKKSRKA